MSKIIIKWKWGCVETIYFKEILFMSITERRINVIFSGNKEKEISAYKAENFNEIKENLLRRVR